jgi:hypothetical protein
MATITPATTYPNGAALNIAGHNANVYSTTAGQGVLSEPNGGLVPANLAPSFTLRDEHVMPEEGTMARMDGTTIPMDVYNNAFGIRDDDDPTYVAVAGLGERVYIPFDVSCVVWQWSFFVSCFQPYLYKTTTDTLDSATMALRVFIDGVEQPAFRRFFPISADIIVDDPGHALRGSNGSTSYDFEHTTQLWFDITKLAQNVSKGFHELTVKLYQPRVVFDPELTANPAEELDITLTAAAFNQPRDSADVTTLTDILVSTVVGTRVSFGTRNARAVMFK